MTVTELPRRATQPSVDRPARWVPTRAGILNVWRYYDEEFAFDRGRLLLRGPNGTGKSKALEVLLPFLFDANLRANRLSTFGTGERTMHWNLMGEGASGTTRVGFVWLEFHLPAEDKWFCCGARLQASSNTTTVHADYFTTSLRIGRPGGLSLLTDAATPLTRSVLEQRLGTSGELYATATDYRAAIRTVLFPGLSEQRYDALITALLQLRMPKLSQRLDPSLLSSLLSRSLPPLGEQEITELAEGFERLDRQRERLVELGREVQAARTLAARQRAYAQRVLRASAATLISATTELDNLTRVARRSSEQHQQAAELKAQVQERIEGLRKEREIVDGRITGLKDSDEYTKGRELDTLRQRVAVSRERAGELRADARRQQELVETDLEAVQAAQQEADAKARLASSRHGDALQAATTANLAGVLAELAAGLEAGTPRQLLRGAVNGRRLQLDAVRAALVDHEKAVDRRGDAESELEAAQGRLAQARGRCETAARVHDERLAELSERVQGWAAGCRELAFPDPQALLDVIASETVLLGIVDTAASAVLEAITRDETATVAERDARRRERDDVLAELDRLDREHDLPPAPPRTRTVDRARLAGAPLWRLVRFVGGIPDGVQGPVEAALEASGVLDAWVGHTGSVEGHDVFADPRALLPVHGPSLADVLEPEPDAAVPPVVVRRLLASIAYGEPPAGHPAGIAPDGRWWLGNLTGSWQKPQAAHIGALARERARRLRRDELRAVLAELDTAIAGHEAKLASLAARRRTVASERASRPDHRELDAAARELAASESVLSQAEAAVRQRIDALEARERAVADALRALTLLAAEHAVPTDPQALDALARAVDRFHDAAQAWLDAHQAVAQARLSVAGLSTQAQRSGAIAARRDVEASRAESEERTLSAELDGAESRIGADYRQVLAELDELRARLRAIGEELDRSQASVNHLAGELGRLEQLRTADATKRDEATAARDRAAGRFRHLAGSLATDAGLDGNERFRAALVESEGVRAALDAARIVAAAWPSLPHAPNNLGDAAHRLSESIHECRTALSERADLDLEADGDVQVFTALVNGVRIGAATLLEILQADAERSRHEITERERELFDQTLTGDTRRHLAARIRQAHELVDAMNARLERVRTASKVAVQLVWQIAKDLPPGTKAARDLLLKDPVRLTDADRKALHQFFRDRIDHARADDTATNWEQQLAQVFDYTAWHQFVVRINRGNGQDWQVLTKKLHGALSGGEKAIALHLPLFAAVAAHYQAVPEAPRLILLDEVFVGVDSSNRGQVFALLSALDLDLVLTSDHEWCTYRELDGIAIHQLITGTDADDAVTTARFVWNGHDLLPDQQAATPGHQG